MINTQNNMAGIATVTFSPCIDKSTSIPVLIPEKKLRCAVPKLEPGGGGINVARVIHKLGGNVVAVFPSGGYTGKYFNHLLEKENVPCVIIETENETRENIIVLDEGEIILSGETKDILKNKVLLEKELGIPQYSILGYELRDRGFNIDIPTTEEQSINIISNIMQKKVIV